MLLTSTRYSHPSAECHSPAFPDDGRPFWNEIPLGFAGGDTNLYRYCGNDPTDKTDPTGRTSSSGNGANGPDCIKLEVAPALVGTNQYWFVIATTEAGDPNKPGPAGGSGHAWVALVDATVTPPKVITSGLHPAPNRCLRPLET